jgi:hypothetical protein
MLTFDPTWYVPVPQSYLVSLLPARAREPPPRRLARAHLSLAPQPQALREGAAALTRIELRALGLTACANVPRARALLRSVMKSSLT